MIKVRYLVTEIFNDGLHLGIIFLLSLAIILACTGKGEENGKIPNSILNKQQNREARIFEYVSRRMSDQGFPLDSVSRMRLSKLVDSIDVSASGGREELVMKRSKVLSIMLLEKQRPQD